MVKRNSAIVKILLVCFVCYSIYTLTTVGIAITKKETLISGLDGEITQQKIDNAELQDMIENGMSKEYLERIAREKLGLAYSNERIFINPEG